jgi:NACalpha-BTF3-like transcription factor
MRAATITLNKEQLKSLTAAIANGLQRVNHYPSKNEDRKLLKELEIKLQDIQDIELIEITFDEQQLKSIKNHINITLHRLGRSAKRKTFEKVFSILVKALKECKNERIKIS